MKRLKNWKNLRGVEAKARVIGTNQETPAPILQVTEERPRGQVEKMLWVAGLLC